MFEEHLLPPVTLTWSVADMYRKVKADTSAMSAMSQFAIGGDAMNKAFEVPANTKANGSVAVNMESVGGTEKQGWWNTSHKAGPGFILHNELCYIYIVFSSISDYYNYHHYLSAFYIFRNYNYIIIIIIIIITS